MRIRDYIAKIDREKAIYETVRITWGQTTVAPNVS